jgi:hypothetical protein
MVSLEDFVKPSSFTQQYIEVPETLTINLGSLIDSKLYDVHLPIPHEVLDPLTFLWTTEYHDAISVALREALSGLEQYGCKILPLVEEMGFGKTHFLILLWHLFTDVAVKWDEVKNRSDLYDVVEQLKKCGYKPHRALGTIIVPLDMLQVIEKDNPYDFLVDTVVRVCEYKALSAAKEVIDLKKLDPIQAAAQLATICFDNRLNLIILVDEIYAAVKRCVQSDSIEKISSAKRIITMITHLIDAVTNRVPTSLVYASAQQDVDAWRVLSINMEVVKPTTKLEREKVDLVNAVRDFESRAARKAVIGLATTKPSHAISIAIKRLLKFNLDRKKAFAQLSSTFQSTLRQMVSDETLVKNYITKLEETFPFTADFMYFVEKLMQPTVIGDFPRTQHIRDILRITSILINRLYSNGLWDKLLLISPTYLVPDDIKHLLPPNLAQEWNRIYNIGKRSIEAETDEELRRVTEIIHRSLYLRAFTANGMKIIDMVRRPDMLALEELRARGATPDELLAHMVGAVEEELLKKAHVAIMNMCEHRVPYVMPIERGGERYLVMTLVMNPMQFIDSMRQDELSKLMTSDGNLDVEKMIQYFETHLANEGFISNIIIEAKRRGMNLIILGSEIFSDERKAFEEFVRKLSDEFFTLVLIHPTSLIIPKDAEGYERTIQEYLLRNKDKINSPNMFAVVVPALSEDLLVRLCTYIADVNAAKKLLGYYKVGTVEEAKIKRKQLAETMPTYRTLREFLAEKPVKEFEEIIDEVMSYLQKRVESFTTALASSKLVSYVTTLCGVFNKIVTYSPRHNTFIVEPIHITAREDLKEPGEVYAHLPLWIFNAVRSTCQVLDANGLRAHILDYSIKESERSKDKILKEGSSRIQYNFIINALKKGWSEIPVKPLSVQNIETALDSLSGYTLAVKDPQLKEVILEVGGKNNEKYILLKKTKEPPPPPPPPPPPGVLGILVRELNNVMIGLYLVKDEKENVRSVSLSMRFDDGGNISLSGVTPERFEEILGGYNIIINKIGRFRNAIKEISLTCRFIKSFQKEDVERMCKKYGIKGYETIEER